MIRADATGAGPAHLSPPPPPARPRRVAVLGVTGSIGENALRVIAAHPDKLQLVAIGARSSHARLIAIARQFPTVRHVALRAEGRFDPPHFPGREITWHVGAAGLRALAVQPEVDVVLVATVGTSGLEPALAALAAGKDLALASKEILVLAGPFILAAAEKSGARILPVDSEHSGVFQCLAGHPGAAARRIILTASGGAFRDWEPARLRHVTPADATRHPNWAMGPKITVDSATLANKGLELIEAQMLFGLAPAQCAAVLHPQSIVHAIVEFHDGSMLAQLSPPSMTFPIQYALLYPGRPPGVDRALDFSQLLSLDFRPVDEGRFPMLALAKNAMHAGGATPAIYNAANEVAVAAFLAERIPFLAIPALVGQVLAQVNPPSHPDLPAVLACDAEARQVATALLPRFPLGR